MFEFSVPCRKPGELKVWLDHFEKTGQPAGIVEHNGAYSLWRTGERLTMMSRQVDKPVGKLIKAVNGFEKEWPGGKAKAA